MNELHGWQEEGVLCEECLFMEPEPLSPSIQSWYYAVRERKKKKSPVFNIPPLIFWCCSSLTRPNWTTEGMRSVDIIKTEHTLEFLCSVKVSSIQHTSIDSRIIAGRRNRMYEIPKIRIYLIQGHEKVSKPKHRLCLGMGWHIRMFDELGD